MKELVFLLLFLGSAPLFAQNLRVDGIVLARDGTPAPGASFAVCTEPATTSTQPCVPSAALCSSLSDTTCTSPNPVTAEESGNYHFYLKSGQIHYILQFYGAGLTARVLTDQGSAASGSLGASVVSFGAKCDGSDAAPAIRQAMAANSHVIVPHCFVGSTLTPYTVCSMDPRKWGNLQFMFWLAAGQEVDFQGGAQLKVGNNCLNNTATNQGGNGFFGNQTDNVTLINVSIDMNGANNLAPNCSCYHPDIAIYFEGGNYDTVDGATIINSPGANGIVNTGSSQGAQGSHFTITNSTISGGGTYLAGNTYQSDWSAMYSEAPHSFFSHNHITAASQCIIAINCGGIELHGNYSTALENTIENTYPAFYVGSAVTNTDISDVTIDRNVLNNVVVGISFYATANADFRRISFTHNDVRLTINPNFTHAPWGVSMFRADTGLVNYSGILYDSDFSGNTFSNSGTPASYASVGLRLSSLNNVSIKNNVCRNLGNVCIALLPNPYGESKVTVENNIGYNVGRTSAPYLVYQSWTTSDISLPVWSATYTYTIPSGYVQYVLPTTPNGYIFKYTTGGTTGSSLPNCTSVGQIIMDGRATLTCTGQWAISNTVVQGNTVAWPATVAGYVLVANYTSGFSIFSGNTFLANYVTNGAALFNLNNSGLYSLNKFK
jgi:hypothetical protein